MARSNRKTDPKDAGAQGANGQGQGEPLTTYFRRVFGASGKLLDTRSNAEVLRRWQNDHPGEAITEQVKAALTNAKSALRQKRRKRRGGKQAAAEAHPVEVSHPLPKAATPPRRLEQLEEQIDDCLSLAKHMGREELAEVIRLLRRARNEVVWKMGQ